MSEAASAAPSAPSAASGATTPGQSQSNAQGKPGAVQAPDAKAQAGKAQPQAKAAPAEPADDFEEIKIGGNSAKVPKAFAKTVKDLERGFQTKAQEAAAFRQLGQLAQAAKDDPRAADLLFEKFGIDADKYSQTRLAQKLQRDLMSPEQRELQELRSEREQRAEQEKKFKEDSDRQKMTAEEQRQNVELRQGLSKALEKSSLDMSDPENQEELSYFAARVVGVYAAADAQGLGWTWDQCVAKVEGDRDRAERARISRMDPESLEKWVGSDGLDKWRAHNLKRVTESASQKLSGQRPGAQPASKSKDGPKQMLSEKEYREWFANRSKNS